MASRNNRGQFTSSVGSTEELRSNGSNGHAPTVNADQQLVMIMNELVANTILSRKEFMSRALDPRRDIDEECGYPSKHGIRAEDYKALYDRDPIAARVVEVMPKETWLVQPTVYEEEDADTITPFEEAWDQLAKDLRGGSLYQDELGSPVWELLKRADILSGVGQYGVILFGLDDGLDLKQPVPGFEQEPARTVEPALQSNTDELSILAWNNCGTGEGGFKPGNQCARGGKDPATMTAGQINKELDKLDQQSSKLTDKMIAEGRGSERPSDWQSKTDDLSLAIKANEDRFAALRREVEKRYGPRAPSRLPSGRMFGPIRNEGVVLNASEPKRKLLYLRCFDESLAKVTRYDDNKNSPRYGQPVMYQLTLADPNSEHAASLGASGMATTTVDVHYSRIQHIADNSGQASSSEILAQPRMKNPYNRILDCRKLYGGSAEGYWQGAFPGLSVETHPNLTEDIKNTSLDLKAIRRALELRRNGLQRDIMLMGMSAKSLAPQVADPTAHLQKQLEAICIIIAIPLRIFLGSERGELSSTQDADTWEGRLKERRTMYVTPKLIVPFVDRLIRYGILPAPEGFSVDWPEPEISEERKTARLTARTEAMSKYVASGLDVLMAPLDYLTREMGYTEEEAEAILDNAVSHVEEANPDAEQDIVPGRNPPNPLDQQAKQAEIEQTRLGVKAGGVPAGKRPFPPKPSLNEGVENSGCGTGAGGFKPGNTCARGGGSAVALYDAAEKQWKLSDGSPLPSHLPKRIPPAWTSVHVSLDSDADLLVKGLDSKGRGQSIYSNNHATRQAALKFSRINELRGKQQAVRKEIEGDLKSRDNTKREAAACALLIQTTGLRPGSDAETGAARKAYGATTLEGRHVIVHGNEVRLQFVGKKGVDLDLPVLDPAVSSMLRQRKHQSGASGKLFATDDKQLRTYVRTKDGGRFKPKDLRTAHGTNIAAKAVSALPVPTTQKAYKEQVKAVAVEVSKALGNTPTIALQSYIDPAVFSKWRKAS